MKINIKTMHQPYDDDFPMEEINPVDPYKEEVEFPKKQNEFLEKSKNQKRPETTLEESNLHRIFPKKNQ